MGLDPLEHRNTVDPLAEPNWKSQATTRAGKIPPTTASPGIRGHLRTPRARSITPTEAHIRMEIPNEAPLKARILHKANPIQARKTTKNTSGDT